MRVLLQLTGDKQILHQNLQNMTRASAIPGLIRRSFSCLDEKLFIKLYTAFVRLHLKVVNRYGRRIS